MTPAEFGRMTGAPSTSLAKQLSAIKTQDLKMGGLSASKKHAPSLLFSSRIAADMEMETIYDMAVNGLNELILKDKCFAKYSQSLFHEDMVEFDRSMKTKAENDLLDKELESFLFCLCPYLLLKTETCFKVLEWLVKRFRIHQHNDDALLAIVLPYHETFIFTRILQLCRLKGSKKWEFLSNCKKTETNPTREFLIQRIKTDQSILELLFGICRWVVHNNSLVQVKNYSSLFNAFSIFLVEFVASFLTLTEDIVKYLMQFVLEILQKMKCAYDLQIGSLMVLCQMSTRFAFNEETLNLVISSAINGCNDCIQHHVILFLAYFFEFQACRLTSKQLKKLVSFKVFESSLIQIKAQAGKVKFLDQAVHLLKQKIRDDGADSQKTSSSTNHKLALFISQLDSAPISKQIREQQVNSVETDEIVEAEKEMNDNEFIASKDHSLPIDLLSNLPKFIKEKSFFKNYPVESIEKLLEEYLILESPEYPMEMLELLLEFLSEMLIDRNAAYSTFYLKQMCLCNIKKLLEESRVAWDGRTELIVQVIRNADDAPLHSLALSIVSLIARIKPEGIVDSILPIFTFMGSSSFVKQDSPYSLQILIETIEAVVPVFIEYGCSASTSSNRPTVTFHDLVPSSHNVVPSSHDLRKSNIYQVISIFASTLNHLPQHRVADIFSSLLEVCGHDSFDIFIECIASKNNNDLLELLSKKMPIRKVLEAFYILIANYNEKLKNSKRRKSDANPRNLDYGSILEATNHLASKKHFKERLRHEAESNLQQIVKLDHILLVIYDIFDDKMLAEKTLFFFDILNSSLDSQHFIKAICILLSEDDCNLKHKVLLVLCNKLQSAIAECSKLNSFDKFLDRSFLETLPYLEGLMDNGSSEAAVVRCKKAAIAATALLVKLYTATQLTRLKKLVAKVIADLGRNRENSEAILEALAEIIRSVGPKSVMWLPRIVSGVLGHVTVAAGLVTDGVSGVEKVSMDKSKSENGIILWNATFNLLESCVIVLDRFLSPHLEELLHFVDSAPLLNKSTENRKNQVKMALESIKSTVRQ